MDKHQNAPIGRPRLQPAAAPELDGIDSLGLARWAAAAASAGLTRSSAAQIAGVSRRTLQRSLRQHGADPLVARDLQLGEGVKWESAGGRALEEATSRALQWLRTATANPGADPREVAAALGASVGAAHRLAEAGSRRAKRLQPQQPEQQSRPDHQALIAAVAQACAEIRQQLPPERQEEALQGLHRQLRIGDQPQAIDVQVIEAQGAEPGAPPCPF